MNKYIICHLIECFEMGGTERVLLKLTQRMNPDKFRNIVVAFRDGMLRREFTEAGIETYVIPRKSTFDILFLLRLSMLLRNLKCQVVHARNSTTSISIGGAAALLNRIPFVSSVHGHGWFNVKSKKMKLWYFMHGKAVSTITVSNSIADELREKLPDRHKIVTISNGIDLHRCDSFHLSIEDIKIVRRTMGVPEGVFVIGCIGSLRAVKGQEMLIRAMSIIASQTDDTYLVIIGEGEDLPQLEQMIISLKIKSRVKFMGIRQDVFDLIQGCDIIAVPSKSEGMSNVLLEAMAFGKPVAATDVGGNPEVVTNRMTGILTPRDDPEKMADAILTLYENPDMRKIMSQNARKRVEEYFSISRMVREYEKEYVMAAKTGSRSVE